MNNSKVEWLGYITPFCSSFVCGIFWSTRWAIKEDCQYMYNIGNVWDVVDLPFNHYIWCNVYTFRLSLQNVVCPEVALCGWDPWTDLKSPQCLPPYLSGCFSVSLTIPFLLPTPLILVRCTVLSMSPARRVPNIWKNWLWENSERNNGMLVMLLRDQYFSNLVVVQSPCL